MNNNITKFYRFLKNNNLFFTYNSYPKQFIIFLNFINNQNALIPYLENLIKFHNQKNLKQKLIEFKCNTCPPCSYITGAFYFDITPQGQTYWYNLHTKWMKQIKNL